MKHIVACLLVGPALVAWPVAASAETDDEHEAHSDDRDSSSDSSRWTSESNGSRSSTRSDDDDHDSTPVRRASDDAGSAVAPRGSRPARDLDRVEPPTLRAPPSWHTRPSASRSSSEPSERPRAELRPARAESYRPSPDRPEAGPVSDLAAAETARPERARHDEVDDEPPVEERTPAEPVAHRRGAQHPRVHVGHASSTVVEVAARSLCLSRCTQSFAVRPRLGAAFLGRADGGVGTLDAGIGLGYLLVPRISLELRGDFLIPFTGETAQDLDSVWLSLNLVWVFVDGRWVRPYVVVGVDLTIVPGDAEQGVEAIVAGGGQAGLGLEVVLASFLGLNLEVLGVVSGTAGEVLEGGVNATASVSFYF